MPITDPQEFLGAADAFLADVEQSKLVSRDELEAVRVDLAKQIRDEAAKGAQGLATTSVGGVRILIPNSQNLRDINLISERTRQRMSNFKLSYLTREQVDELRDGPTALSDDPQKFIRHSRRLAKHSREFLTRIKELEPDLEEEVDQALMQLEDNEMDLLKLEVKSFTRMRETLLRSVQGKKERGQVLKEIEAFDLNKNQWNLSLLEHPRASVQGLLANAAEAMGSRATTVVSELPKLSKVLVAPTPDAQTRMTPSSRTAKIAWRIFSTGDLDKRFASIGSGKQKTAPSWRGLGLDFNTTEWYLPVPPEIAEGLAPLAQARRLAMLNILEQAQEAGAL